jgi:photosystem II stability/assembly factor-like uncharacterized protein
MSARARGRRTCLVISLILMVVACAPTWACGAPASTGYGGWSWLYPRPQGNSLAAVKCVGTTRAWAVGDAGSIFKTSNGGLTWGRQASGVMRRLTDVDFTDSTYGWAVGGNGSDGRVVLKTTNGGKTWKTVGSSTLPANMSISKVDFVDRKFGWIGCENGKVYKTANGGKTWKALSVPLHAAVTCLRFLSRQTGWVCGAGGFEVG